MMYMSWACLMMPSKTFIRKYHNLPHRSQKGYNKLIQYLQMIMQTDITRQVTK